MLTASTDNVRGLGKLGVDDLRGVSWVVADAANG